MMARLAKGMAAVAMAGGLLAACETADPIQRLPELTFSHLRPLALDVAAVDVVHEYKPPMKAPNADHEFPTPPARVVEAWARARLKPVGSARRARVVIRDASVIETGLKKGTGIQAKFTLEQSERYDAALHVVVEIVDGRGHAVAFAEARASQARSVREDSSLRDRERIWFEMTESLMAAFDREMERNIRRYLVNWLR